MCQGNRIEIYVLDCSEITGGQQYLLPIIAGLLRRMRNPKGIQDGGVNGTDTFAQIHSNGHGSSVDRSEHRRIPVLVIMLNNAPFGYRSLWGRAINRWRVRSCDGYRGAWRSGNLS